MSAILGIRDDALSAWRALHDTIAQATRPTPCSAEPDVWAEPLTDDLAATAATLCGRCPALTECRLFADLNRERLGIWAGTNRTPRPGRKPNPTKETPAA